MIMSPYEKALYKQVYDSLLEEDRKSIEKYKEEWYKTYGDGFKPGDTVTVNTKTNEVLDRKDVMYDLSCLDEIEYMIHPKYPLLDHLTDEIMKRIIKARKLDPKYLSEYYILNDGYPMSLDTIPSTTRFTIEDLTLKKLKTLFTIKPYCSVEIIHKYSSLNETTAWDKDDLTKLGLNLCDLHKDACLEPELKKYQNMENKRIMVARPKYDDFLNTYVCELTEYIDKYLYIPKWCKTTKEKIEYYMYNRSYLYDPKAEICQGFKDNILGQEIQRDGIYIAWRSPGSTKGHIKLDENHVITEIKIYEDTAYGKNSFNVYDKQVESNFSQFIGRTLVLYDHPEEDLYEKWLKD